MIEATEGRPPRKSDDKTSREDDKDRAGDRPEESLEDKTRRDQQAGDVADDLADFA